MGHWIDTVVDRFSHGNRSRLPFSFLCGGQPFSSVGGDWTPIGADGPRRSGQIKQAFSASLGDSGLRALCQVTRFQDFPACEWVLVFENTGSEDSPLVEEIAVADHTFDMRLPDIPEAAISECDRILPRQRFFREQSAPFVLHRTNGAPSNATDFEVTRLALCAKAHAVLCAGGGRSSNHDLPFFRIDCGRGAAIVAVGWSGQWQATLDVSENGESLRLRCGMEHARFYLKPGERVRLPSILLFLHQGEYRESNAQFRRLLNAHHVPKIQDRDGGAYLYCNTCFTRKGAWLNECNEQNQISLIRALGHLGVEAVITDAGWFVGGWPEGAGNWEPDPDKYPRGMAPVAQAAKDAGAIYGLWFEPERVVRGTTVHREHPEWVLWSNQSTTVKGSELASGYTLTLPRPGKSDLISYYRKGTGTSNKSGAGSPNQRSLD